MSGQAFWNLEMTSVKESVFDEDLDFVGDDNN